MGRGPETKHRGHRPGQNGGPDPGGPGRPQPVPCHDVEADLVYSARGSNVVMNMARGRVIYEKGEFFTLDLEKIRAEVEAMPCPGFW